MTRVDPEPMPTAAELTTVADDEAIVHDGAAVRRYDGLAPDTDYELEGFRFCTLPRLGERLATVATVNDVHFGEVECGIMAGDENGPVFRVAAGEEPYPELMNRGAVQEITAIDPDAVIVKGDLTSEGTDEEYAAFLAAYREPFGERLLHVRGNHDAYEHQDFAPSGPQQVDVPGLTVALLDTTIPGLPSGGVGAEQVAWLEQVAADADRPVLVMGHHHVWHPASSSRPLSYFGINPDDSERLIAAVARHPGILGYVCGHTHRNRVRTIPATGDRPWAEVACVKDYPGTWAEYRVFDGGVLQIHRRISTPDALAWTEQTRGMFAGYYAQYAFGTLADRCFALRARA
ncbi:MAG TPA: metallophosphoesterase [Acidimicrobiales bacterium]|nr:metallophosphoesterase [Acidimicrobiales bacterium]